MALTDQLSGIVLNQNAIANQLVNPASFYQTFGLPPDFTRGNTTTITPALTGFQLFGVIGAFTGPPEYPETDLLLSPFLYPSMAASLDWELDVFLNGSWTPLASATIVPDPPVTGSAWLTVLFPTPVPITAPTALYRLKLRTTLDIEFYGVSPNPLSIGQAYDDTFSPFVFTADPDSTGSFCFRILATIADSGTDFLGNAYRSVAVTANAENVSPIVSGSPSFWLSTPNPSSFGVEAIYFDLRDAGSPVVIDRVTLDPFTPNINFTVYYSSDPTGPGTDTASWDNLLWTPIYEQYQATRKNTYAFPNPISAKWIKLEFTNLQARSYDPGNFQIPTTFRKYPKWVLDYFLLRFAAQDVDLASSSLNVTYDLLDLAFSYYQGDVSQDPDIPALSVDASGNVALQFLQTSTADQIDPTTLSLISAAFQPYLSQPALQGPALSLLGQAAAVNAAASYSVEVPNLARADTTVVSNLQREPLLIEKGFPAMFFMVPCRHAYRISQSLFEKHVAYFAGVNTVAFHRDIYTGRLDQTQYNEILGDDVNIQIDDTVVQAAFAPLPRLT